MRTEGEKSDATRLPQGERKHPDEWADTLNPNRMAGQNVGPADEREVAVQTAYDVKEIHRALQGFRDDELKQVPILPVGSRLQQGATYVDLADDDREEIKPTGGLAAERGHYWVPKDRVPYEIWNRLVARPSAAR
jgi:hypothetical protein